MSAKRGTYLVEFSNSTKIVCGNNYKSWNQHAVEYAWSRFQDGRPHSDLVVSVKFSDVPFCDDGGLKYATPGAYQEIIDQRSKELKHELIPFKNISFAFSNADKKKLDKDLKYWGLI